MKIEITIPTPSLQALRYSGVAVFLLVSAVLLAQLGLAAWLLLLALCLLLLAIGLSWASVTTVAERNTMTLDEALDLAAPARDEERKLAVLRGIKDLEYERSLGKISEQDYVELIRRYRNDARRLLQNLDTSEASLRQQAIDMVEAKLASETSPLEQSNPNQSDPVVSSESVAAQEPSAALSPKDT